MEVDVIAHLVAGSGMSPDGAPQLEVVDRGQQRSMAHLPAVARQSVIAGALDSDYSLGLVGSIGNRTFLLSSQRNPFRGSSWRY